MVIIDLVTVRWRANQDFFRTFFTPLNAEFDDVSDEPGPIELRQRKNRKKRQKIGKKIAKNW